MILNSSLDLLIPDPEQAARADRVRELLKRLREERLAKELAMKVTIMVHATPRPSRKIASEL